MGFRKNARRNGDVVMIKLQLRHSTREEKITLLVFFVIFLLFACMYLVPLFWVVVNSLRDSGDYFDNVFALPSTLNFQNYLNVFSEFYVGDYYFLDMLFNSLWILVVKVVVNVASSSMLAYAIARFRFPGKDLLYSIVLFVNVIPIVGNGPAAFKLLNSLQMVNNPFTIWLYWAGGFDFAFVVLYGYFKGISPTYSEAAMIDGANNLKILFKIILPLAFPCMIAIMINQAISVWNDYSTPMIYLREYPNLAYGLYLFEKSSFLIDRTVYFAAIVLSCIPVIVLYACSQNILLTNLTAGGLKG